MSVPPVILWFRQDLRLQDNPALQAALTRGGPVIPLYILDPEGAGDWPAGGASRWWLHHSLVALDVSLRARGSKLVLARGRSGDVIGTLMAAAGAGAVYWNRCYEPAAIARDRSIKARLSAAGTEARSFNAALLFEPHEVANRQGNPFQVFTPYWRHCLARETAAPVRTRAGDFPAPPRWPASLAAEELGLLPRIRWDAGLRDAWTPGEEGARQRLRAFVAGRMESYSERRDEPSAGGTSRLSPHLHFGEIGPRQIWAAVRALSRDSGVFPPGRGAQTWLTELGWREFAHHLLYHFPTTTNRPLRGDFDRFPWADDPGGVKLHAWRKGRTGYPIVDAGMRELWHTGWMHNRVRMITASFLVKHLRLPWQRGAEWFWDTLVDADLANNTLGWQWSAGCGADAAPYFRIFAPVTQGGKFDRAGEYVRRWVPEVAGLPDKFIHSPWTAPEDERRRAGIDGNYPDPIVDHAEARAAALAAFKSLK